MIALLLFTASMAIGMLSLSLLNRSLIQAVDEDLRNGLDGILAVAAAEFAGDHDSPADVEYAPVDFVVELRDGHGNTREKIVHHSANPSLRVDFPAMTPSEIIDQDARPFTVTDSHDNRWRAVAMVNTNPEGGSVFVALPLGGVDSTMQEMALITAIVNSLVVVVGTVLGGYLTHRSLLPLRDVEATASQIAAGGLSRRVPETNTSYEVNALAMALNEMLVRIDKAFTAQIESEARATASEAKMRRFVGDASHELRTPLAAIRGFGELYRMGALTNPDDVSQAMRRIEDEARRMGSLVENLLRLARLDENPDIDLEPVDLSNALFDAAQDLRALDPIRNVNVVDLDGEVIPASQMTPVGVLGNEASLRQVILNLVGNANRHTPKGSAVEIAVGMKPAVNGDDDYDDAAVTRSGSGSKRAGSTPGEEAGTVVIEVRDHGPGIDADQRDTVFERFYRTDSSRTRSATQGGGAGLGLSIAATIVRQHKGEISVHETPGGGATFRVQLQAVPLTPSQEQPPDQTRVLGCGDNSS